MAELLLVDRMTIDLRDDIAAETKGLGLAVGQDAKDQVACFGAC